ncbi:MAG: cold shock domain-containing protein [Ardenticatenaceae bacterium]|nr:cold shock domain-containing protein [Ardenticatenaceae bacterium]
MQDDEFREKRDEEIPTETRLSGYVKWFDTQKKYGFIQSEEGADVFVHASSVTGEPQTLKEYDRVEFTLVSTEKGAEAYDVTIVSEAA